MRRLFLQGKVESRTLWFFVSNVLKDNFFPSKSEEGKMNCSPIYLY